MKYSSASIEFIRLLALPGIGNAKLRKILHWSKSHHIDLGEFLRDRNAFGKFLNDKQIKSLESNERTICELLEEADNHEVKLINITETDYPKRLIEILGKNAPLLISVRGNSQLLNSISVGFCGSRKASERGLETASDIASQLSESGFNVVSGYASGVDMATHKAALESGGTTTLVLPEGIFNFRIKREIKEIWDWNRTVVISEFLPNRPWRAANAMQRNNTICALVHAMVLIEARSSGGSIEAGKTCLKLRIPLYAPVYEGMSESATGNRELLTQGALPVGKNKFRNSANVDHIIHTIKTRLSSRDELTEEEKIKNQQPELFKTLSG